MDKPYPISIQEIMEATGGVLQNCSNQQILARGISIDSRTINTQEIFLALKGERVNGANYAKKAADNGASLIITETNIDYQAQNIQIPIVLVKNGLQAIQKIASAHRQRIPTKIIAITGSVGKTTTKEITGLLLDAKYKTFTGFGNFNNHLGLPINIINITQDADYAILEMGMSGAGEINLLSSIAQPDIAVITAIAPAHLEAMGSIENIAHAKAEIFNHTKNNGTAIICCNQQSHINHILTAAATQRKLNIITFGTNPSANFVIKNIKKQLYQSLAEIQTTTNHNFNLCINLPIPHLIHCALPALIVGMQCGLDMQEGLQTLKLFRGISGRNQFLTLKNHNKTLYVLDGSYNASPESMIESINTITNLAKEHKGRAVLIIGDMGELGGESNKLHHNLAQHIDEQAIVYAVGKTMTEHLLPNIKPKHQGMHFSNAKDAALHYLKESQNNDYILVKGSNFMNMSDAVKLLTAQPDTQSN